MFAITHRKIFFGLSLAMVIGSLVLLGVFNMKPSIDFTGGSLLELVYPAGRPNQDVIQAHVANQHIGTTLVRFTGEQGVLIRMPTISYETKESLKTALSENGTIEIIENRFNTIGPTIGRELLIQSIVAICMVLIAIVLYVVYVFRHVSKPVSSWKYGFATIIALAHDIVITLGAFVILGQLFGTEVDTLFVTALLVILGYSVNDSIVALDRIRENVSQQPEDVRGRNFSETVGQSLHETIPRSFNTSFTTILSLVALVLFGGEATRDFALALIVGIAVGTYSSIFIAPALLVSFFERQQKKAIVKKG